MALRDTSEIYEAIEANLPSHFVFDEETTVYVWNCIDKKSYRMTVPEKMIDSLNRSHPFERGLLLSEYIASTY